MRIYFCPMNSSLSITLDRFLYCYHCRISGEAREKDQFFLNGKIASDKEANNWHSFLDKIGTGSL